MSCLRSSLAVSVFLSFASIPAQAPKPTFGIPWIDLDGEAARQVVVDREEGQYLGHPTTLLLEDQKTILCVYPKGHGKGPIVYKRSQDGGLTWSERLETPKSWETSQEVPTLHPLIDAEGNRRVIMFSGLHPVRMAVSEDQGRTWSELKPVGEWGGIVVMGSVVALRTPGRYMALFHDDGRFFRKEAHQQRPVVMTVYKTFTNDGGLTWATPTTVFASSEIHLCEPGTIRSPDGKTLAVLLRENARRANSHIMFSSDEGETFSTPKPLQGSLTGDRHTAVQTPDGRLFISFRDRSPKGYKSPTEGDWVGWVGTWDDLAHQREGQYRVRLKDNHHQWDCAYPGVEMLADGTIVTTTYGHWVQGKKPYILSVRVKLRELDARLPSLEKD